MEMAFYKQQFTSSDIEPHLLSRPTNVPIECRLIPQDIGPSIVSTLVDWVLFLLIFVFINLKFKKKINFFLYLGDTNTSSFSW